MEKDRDHPKSPERHWKDLNRSLDEDGGEIGNGSRVAFAIVAVAIIAFMVLVMLL